ncbi:hypothetical protein AMATHDRAFT_135269 [Amanita thiersii Skay4041]|uniref:Phosphoglycerate mutase n=1 Tax=Amanita thiersii Skay4041 TaxID=703135 RepID=A0A2A9NZQ3_9AGAR|nr:hypothetical protein AMATHDRAFT_135269 [Amanita thiersii Skay4041]
MTSLRIFLVRHGETDANREKIMQGQLDTPLNDTGLQQARLVAQRLQSVQFDIAYTSDLQRAVKTAETIVSDQQGLDLVKCKELRERFMGNIQGEKYTRWIGRMLKIDSTVEAGASFLDRMSGWWNREIMGLATSLAPKEDESAYNILVISHGGVIGTLVRSLIREQVISCGTGVMVVNCPNTCISIVEMGGNGRGVLVKYGDDSHLDGTGLKENVDEVR